MGPEEIRQGITNDAAMLLKAVKRIVTPNRVFGIPEQIIAAAFFTNLVLKMPPPSALISHATELGAGNVACAVIAITLGLVSGLLSLEQWQAFARVGIASVVWFAKLLSTTNLGQSEADSAVVAAESAQSPAEDSAIRPGSAASGLPVDKGKARDTTAANKITEEARTTRSLTDEEKAAIMKRRLLEKREASLRAQAEATGVGPSFAQQPDNGKEVNVRSGPTSEVRPVRTPREPSEGHDRPDRPSTGAAETPEERAKRKEDALRNYMLLKPSGVGLSGVAAHPETPSTLASETDGKTPEQTHRTDAADFEQQPSTELVVPPPQKDINLVSNQSDVESAGAGTVKEQKTAVATLPLDGVTSGSDSSSSRDLDTSAAKSGNTRAARASSRTSPPEGGDAEARAKHKLEEMKRRMLAERQSSGNMTSIGRDMSDVEAIARAKAKDRALRAYLAQKAAAAAATGDSATRDAAVNTSTRTRSREQNPSTPTSPKVGEQEPRDTETRAQTATKEDYMRKKAATPRAAGLQSQSISAQGDACFTNSKINTSAPEAASKPDLPPKSEQRKPTTVEDAPDVDAPPATSSSRTVSRHREDQTAAATAKSTAAPDASERGERRHIETPESAVDITSRDEARRVYLVQRQKRKDAEAAARAASKSEANVPRREPRSAIDPPAMPITRERTTGTSRSVPSDTDLPYRESPEDQSTQASLAPDVAALKDKQRAKELAIKDYMAKKAKAKARQLNQTSSKSPASSSAKSTDKGPPVPDELVAPADKPLKSALKKPSVSFSGVPESEGFGNEVPNYFLTKCGPARPALVPFPHGLYPKAGKPPGTLWFNNIPTDASQLMAPTIRPRKKSAV